MAGQISRSNEDRPEAHPKSEAAARASAADRLVETRQIERCCILTRNELLLVALARIADGEASTLAVAELTQIPERSARRGLAALIRQALVWSPVRGRWRLTPTGLEIATSLSPTAQPQPEESLATALLRDGLGALLSHSRAKRSKGSER